MDTAFDVLLWLLAITLIVGGLVGTLLPVLPGAPLVFFGLWVLALIDHYQHVGTPTLVLLGVLAVLSALIDFVASSLGVQRVGASRQAVSGALAGSIIGAFFGIPGLLFGPFIGAVAGELMARSRLDQAARVGIATWVGMLLGSLAKLALGLAMIAIFAFAWFI